jgi:hypothetical protein
VEVRLPPGGYRDDNLRLTGTVMYGSQRAAAELAVAGLAQAQQPGQEPAGQERPRWDHRADRLPGGKHDRPFGIKRLFFRSHTGTSPGLSICLIS